MNTIELIEKYTVYLITECGLSVTIHPMEEESLITFSRLMRFNIHDNSYCACVKASPEGYSRCLAQQGRVHRKCREIEDGFFGVCHAGVFEYVYPFRDGSRVVGFISVSGYSAGLDKKRIAALAEALGLNADQLARSYSSLRGEREDRERLDTLILPLCRMIELAYLAETGGEVEETPVRRICRYVHQNYATDLTTEQICRRFYCSRSYFSHTFKKETGKSFREYLIDVRISHAKRLLRYSALGIGEVAFSVGFADANYFSNVFRHRVGISPIAYRKKGRG